MEVFLYFWLTGWAITSGIEVSECEPQTGKCITEAVAGGIIWPKYVIEEIRERER